MAPSGGAILVWFLLFAVHSFAQEILHAPESTTVFVNQSAVFTCEVRGGIALWRINGTQRESLLNEIPGDLNVSEISTSSGTTVETLTIPARAQYNGTTVQCLSVIFGGPSVESDNATLTIQGILAAVYNEEATDSAPSVTISWSAPFSLDVTGVDPDIWYSVLIYNVTDENNPTTILCTDCINITETHYTFTPDQPSPCHMYNFSVIPLNGAGQGESSPSITGYVLNYPPILRPLIEALFTNTCRVTFLIERYDASGCNYFILPDVDVNSSQIGPSVVFELPSDREYFFKRSISNVAGKVATTVIHFTTYDIQNVTTNASGMNEITVTENYIINTRAKGSLIVLLCEDNSHDEFMVLPRPETKTTVTRVINNVSASAFNMSSYDQEADGLPNANLAYSNTLTVRGRASTDYKPASLFIENAIIYLNGSEVQIECMLKDDIVGASCVLVYRECGNNTIVVKEYPQNTVFPVPVTVDGDLENYTFAIFGRNSSYFDERPILTTRLEVTRATTPSQVPSVTIADVKRDGNTLSTAAVVGVVLLSCVIIFLIMVSTLILVSRTLRKLRKSHKTDGNDYPPGGVPHSPTSGSFTSTRVETTPNCMNRRGSEVSTGSNDRLMNNEVAEDKGGVKGENAYAALARSAYAEIGPLPAGRPKPLEMVTRTQCPYDVVILPHATTPINDNGNRGNKNADQATPKGPPTVESVMSLLWGVAGRWKEIAEGLEFDEDLIDEIYTNNEMNEGCLQVCVEMWIFKLQPSWEKLSRALRDMEEVELARQAGNKEPQEQRQVPSRQTSDSSSSGVVADASSDFSGEVVPGVEKTPATNDGNNEDGSRGGKKMMPDDCSSGEQGARSVFLAYPALNEEGPTVSGSSDEDEDTNCDVGTTSTIESGEGEKVTVVSGTDLFDFPYKPSLGEFHVLPPLDGNDDPDFAQDPVSLHGADDDYHSGSISSGRQKSTSTLDTVKVIGRDFIMGSVVVVPWQFTGFSGITGPEETDTTRGPFRQPAKEVDSLSMCVNESQLCAGRFGHNKAVYPSLSFLTGAGMLVVGGPYTRRDIFKTVPDEQSPELLEYLPRPSPEETDSSKPPPLDPTPPHSQLPEVSPLQVQENNPTTPPPPPPPPPPPLQSSKIVDKVSTPLKERQYLDPPGNYQEKIVKWLHTGASRGFHGPDLLIQLCALGAPHFVELPSSAAI